MEESLTSRFEAVIQYDLRISSSSLPRVYHAITLMHAFIKSVLGIVTYLHTEDTLYAHKSVPSWFFLLFMTPKLTNVNI